MKNDKYFQHDVSACGNVKLMALIDKEGMKGYGIYWVVLEFLRQQESYLSPLKMLSFVAHRAKVTRKFVERVVMDYDLFVIEKECFYSPGMHKRMHTYDQKTLANSENARKAAIAKWQKIRENKHAAAMQREEKRGEETISCCCTTTSADASAASAKLSEIVSWECHVSEAMKDRSWLELEAMHSGLGRQFFQHLPIIVEAFRNHVRTYGTEHTILSLRDMKSYFSNFIKRGSATRKMVEEVIKAASAVDVYRYETLVDGRRTYCGVNIPEEAPPRPNPDSRWNEQAKRWER
ncbi:Lin1244/Lin1753 domain-containing protein [uncultured Bacteroides sp.]|uniref:DUF7833 domain-containing protein n=1 Tax=uncultured Bacteroides sp. TaxID=162156 RepID=UPI002AA64194|nr:Lin1244/Lin1753 domain-containing protein [uncultured Bacteroides sp.]